MRAKPYITCGLLAGALTLPVSVFALGLGKLTVQSALGQPLSATIELTSAQKDELDTLRARIADPAVYRDNNVQYPSAMSRARIVVEQTANGAPYLRVTTSQAVNDAFLDLLVELNWATGRVVRDYTFLLDPPSSTETQASPRRRSAPRRDPLPLRALRPHPLRPPLLPPRRLRPLRADRPQLRPPRVRPPPGRPIRSSAATRYRRSLSRRNPKTSASSRCWSLCSAAMRTLSTTAT
jgi:pilus assembly protein FimV